MGRGGRNETTEEGRVSAGEQYNSSRGPGKTDSGVKSREKKGFGSETGMQVNSRKPKAPKF